MEEEISRKGAKKNFCHRGGGELREFKNFLTELTRYNRISIIILSRNAPDPLFLKLCESIPGWMVLDMVEKFAGCGFARGRG